jgi:signal transduction histidine kinase
MSLYPLVPLCACLLSAVIATAIFARETREPANRLAAALVGAASFWAFCEVLWNVQARPEPALLLVKASALAWVWLAPLALHLFTELAGRPLARVRRALPWCYGVSALFLCIALFTPWMHTGVVRRSWGWAYEFGPAYGPFCAFMLGCIAVALSIGRRAIQDSSSPAERGQVRLVTLGILVPLVVASLTDGALPFFGWQPPRFGTAAFGVLGAVILWSFHRYGYSVLAPGNFASEVLETLPDGVAMLRPDGSIRSANGALARLLGAERTALPGLRVGEHLDVPLDPAGEPVERHCHLRALDGRLVPVAVSSRLLRDRRGAEIGSVLVLRDRDEVESLRDRLLLSGRLAAVGELAAGIAHEINNPLAFVRSNLTLLRQHWSELSTQLAKAAGRAVAADVVAEGEELLDESLEGVDRASAIVRDVRGLAHGGRAEKQAADLGELLGGVLRIAAPQLRGNVRVETRLSDVPPVWGAPHELQQVFLNLLLNAIQAIDDDGHVWISTECDGRFVVTTVADDGCGIAPEIFDRIFDPFFTTKPVGEGSGLGLGIAHGIVQGHGGHLSVASEPGRGTRFRVHLPMAADTLEGPCDGDASAAPASWSPRSASGR